MEREQLVGAGFRGWRLCLCTRGSGYQCVCGRLFHDGERQRGQLHRQMGREQLVTLGSGMNSNGYVFALAASSSDLYAAGQFTTAGHAAVNYIAKWDGSSWTA